MKKSPLLNLILLVLLVVSVLWLYWPGSSGEKDRHPGVADYVLAVSWQPAFCEKRPNVRECRSQRAGRFDVDNFSLHGLWPQPHGNIYCDVPGDLVNVDKSGKWRKLPKLDLSERLRDELSRKMPGYQSGLHRHEWFKHGTCMPGASPEEYFRISLDLLDQLNNSAFRDVIKSNKGRKLSFREVEQPFIKSFGKGADDKMIVDCYRDNGRRILQELKLSLKGDLANDRTLSGLLADGRTVGKSCPSGIIDRVGLQ